MAERTDILRKIRAMLDRADHPNTPPEEADTARRMADEMMARFTIEAFELEFAKPAGTREKPIVREWQYGDSDDGMSMEEREAFATLFYYLADLCGVKMGYWGYRTSKVVGYERDLDYLDLLFTSVRMHLSANLQPKPEHGLDWVTNLARLKRAGMKWEDIHYRMEKAKLADYPYNDLPWKRNIGVAFTKKFTDYCAEHGEFRMKESPQVWKRSFLEGFVAEVRDRVRQLKGLRNEHNMGKELVLAGMEEDLLSALWDAFPHLRPHDPGCDCDTCHRCRDPQCQRRNCVARRAPVKAGSSKQTFRELRFSSAAAAAGRKAGSTVDLSAGGVGGKRGEVSG